ncbi:hypothetical protein LUZ60_009657 [Juncus effusus]|nr:hypothetical protein LUZ60_009657 [Juncus effusus]
MASSSELSLDYKPNIAYPSMIPKTNGSDNSDQTQKLQEFLLHLEEERLKIEAFKRELPLCMQLLNNAVEAYRQQLEIYRSSQGPKPVLEEFIPIKQIGIEGNDKENNNPQSEKSSWMESAQLWSPSSNDVKKPQIQFKENSENPTLDMNNKVGLDVNQRNGGGAFVPFSKEKSKSNDLNSKVLPELALVAVENEREDQKIRQSDQVDNSSVVKKENGDQMQGRKVCEGQVGTTQAHRKARRCWSPDLHRRFVNALQILGGAQVATPKQIRELMKVDGLTNDEVKSHLQKYRLHTRRPIPAPQPATSAPPQLVVLGGIWVPHEYATSAAGPAIYGAHHGGPPPHYCTAGPPEFYASQALMAPPLHQSQIRHSLNGSFKNRNASSESEGRSGGERSESIEEEGEEREEEEEEEEDDDVVPVPCTDGTGGTEVALKF